MRAIYSMSDTIRRLKQIPGAIQGDPASELTDAGPYLAELIEQHARMGEANLDPDQSLVQPPGDDGEVEGADSDDLTSASGFDALFSYSGSDELGDVLARLSGTRGQEYQRHKLLRGVDALGYYLTFHQTQYQWGIYLPITGIADLAQTTFGGVSDPHLRFNLAAYAILSHEYLHFAADYAMAQFELLRRDPLFWRVANSAGRSDLKQSEERLANARMLGRFRHLPSRLGAKGAFTSLRNFTLTQPEGYRDGYQLVGSRYKFERALIDHAHFAWDLGWAEGAPHGVEWQQLYPWQRQYDLQRCPIHVIHDELRFGIGDLGLAFVRAISGIAESDRFRKSLRDMTKRDAEKWLDTKRKLSQSTQVGGLDFKRWPPGGGNCFSVRVTRSIRAHLMLDHATHTWIADDIGEHQAMGHG